MTPLIGPLAPDCEVLRQSLIDDPLPPVWQLAAQSARRIHRSRILAALPDWRPALESLPVAVDDLPGQDSMPAMRRYRHEGSIPDTCVVWLHGGGWVLGDLDTADATARTACDATGWTVLAVDYRCAPAAPFPAAVTDALAAADWALSRYERVVIGGDSAGANLAAVVAQQRGHHRSLVGQVLVYPVVDTRMDSPSAREFVEGPLLTRRDMEWFFDQYVPNEADRDSSLIDLRTGFADRGVVPVTAVVLTVGHDPLRDEGIAYARLLDDNAHEVTWIHAPELHHGAFTQSGFLSSAAVRVREVWSAARRSFA